MLRHIVVAALVIGTLIMIGRTSAQTTTWVGPVGGSWSESSHWAGGAIPNSVNAIALVDGGNSANSNAVINGTITLGTLRVSAGDRVTIGGGAGGGGTEARQACASTPMETPA